MVINNKQAVIDHVFFTPAPNPQKQLGSVRVAEETNATPSSAPSKGALTFSHGPLSITAVTLQFKDQTDGQYLTVTMDATFVLGPISFSLLGFSIGVPLSDLHLV